MTGLFLAALTVGLLVYALQIVSSAVQERLADEPRAPQARERVFAVNTVTAQPDTVHPILETFGQIEARRTLEVRAAVPGRVVSLSERFEDGGEVQAGDVLVQIDPAETQAEIDRLTADLDDAKAEQRDARRSLELARAEQAAAEDQAALREKAFQRQADLAGRGVGTAAAIEEAELAAAAARANVLARRQAVAQAEARIDLSATRLRRAEIALAEARRDLADTTITAPFDGILNETSLVQGRLVSVNEQVAELIDPSDLEVAFRVSNAQYARLIDPAGGLVEAPARVILDAGGVDLSAKGRLVRVDAATGEGQAGRMVFAELEAAAGFRPGDFVTVRVTEPAVEDVVRLPAAALGADGQVLVVDAENRLEALPVTLVRRQSDDVLVRGDGLTGRDVVAARTPLLGPGIAVRIVDPSPQDEARADVPSGMLDLTAERRARLVAFIEANDRMPADAKARVLAQLSERRVPAQVVERLERRMGG
jgi:RND family efflux transporter MFP subunit